MPDEISPPRSEFAASEHEDSEPEAVEADSSDLTHIQDSRYIPTKTARRNMAEAPRKSDGKIMSGMGHHHLFPNLGKDGLLDRFINNALLGYR